MHTLFRFHFSFTHIMVYYYGNGLDLLRTFCTVSGIWHNGLCYKCMWSTHNIFICKAFPWLHTLCLPPISCLVHFYVRRKRVLLFNAVFVPTMPLTLAINHLANRPNFICTLILWAFEGEFLFSLCTFLPDSLSQTFSFPFLCHPLFSLLLSSSPFP